MEIIELKELETWMVVYFSVIAFILGTVLGSFLNCAAWRISRKMDFVKGRSICPKCKHELSA
ncbi:MAG: prepilin peptidase, partial [Lachnospiraceae bacterium]|nr:prepilin peptidase [Lachnospiraceae bacterium]